MGKTINIIKQDFKLYKQRNKIGFLRCFITISEFRYLVYYRLRRNSSFFNIVLKPLKLFNSLNLYFNCDDIGEGLFIQHGFSTIITCKHIGKNCWINQQVTIGYHNGYPSIGDNVTIWAGAKVIGNITIGDDVIIGANAVVTKDIPSHSIVVGVPAKVIKTRESMDMEWKRID